jgi:hypothetical protein
VDIAINLTSRGAGRTNSSKSINVEVWDVKLDAESVTFVLTAAKDLDLMPFECTKESMLRLI